MRGAPPSCLLAELATTPADELLNAGWELAAEACHAVVGIDLTGDANESNMQHNKRIGTLASDTQETAWCLGKVNGSNMQHNKSIGNLASDTQETARSSGNVNESSMQRNKSIGKPGVRYIRNSLELRQSD